MHKIVEKTFAGAFIKSDEIERIVVPDLQRDYAQGRNNPQTNSVLKNLVRDVKAALVENKKCDLGFVYGSVENRTFIPIDGQQRLTFLFLLHFYVAFRLGKTFFETFQLDYETRGSSRRFFEKLSSFTCKGQASVEPRREIENSVWFQHSWSFDPTVQNALFVIDNISKEFKDTDPVLLFQKLSSENPKRCGIYFSILYIDGIGDGGDLYVKMNARGKPLTQWEIIKPFLSAQCGFDENENLFDTRYLEAIYEKIDNSSGYSCIPHCDAFMYNLCCAITNNLSQCEGGELLDRKDAGSAENYKSFLLSLSQTHRSENNGAFLAEAGKLIKATFELLAALPNDAVETDFIFGQNHFALGSRTYTQPERVLLFAVSTYAKSRFIDSNLTFDLTQFSYFFRSIKNIIFASNIDNEKKMPDALRSVKDLSKKLIGADFYASMANLDENLKLNRLDKNSINEERGKAMLITRAANSGDAISAFHHVEDTMSYFNGNIAFVLRLSNLFDNKNMPNLSHANNIQKKIAETLEYLGHFFNMENEGKLKSDLDRPESKFFRRALLTYGDYSIPNNPHSLGTYNFFFEGENGYFTWRRFMKEQKQFAIFRRLIDDFVSAQCPDVTSFLQLKIDTYACHPTSRFECFVRALIKRQDLFAYMNNNIFSYDASHPLILFKKRNRNGQQRDFISGAVFSKLEEARPNRYIMKRLENNALDLLVDKETSKIVARPEGTDSLRISQSNEIITIDWTDFDASIERIVEQLV